MSDPGRFPRLPQREPLDPPDVEVGAAPTVEVEISTSWRSLIVGALEPLTYHSAWRGTIEQVNLAVDRVNEIVALFMAEGAGPGEGVWILGSELDSQLGTTTILG